MGGGRFHAPPTVRSCPAPSGGRPIRGGRPPRRQAPARRVEGERAVSQALLDQPGALAHPAIQARLLSNAPRMDRPSPFCSVRRRAASVGQAGQACLDAARPICPRAGALHRTPSGAVQHPPWYRSASSRARRGRTAPGGAQVTAAPEQMRREGMAQRVRRRAAASPSAPRSRSVAIWMMRGDSGPPFAPTNSGPCGGR